MPAGSILVADDDSAIRTVLNQALSRAGYEVRSTGFGATPRLRVSGEIRGESQLGAAVHALSTASGAYLAVGAPWSSADDYIDDGASYVVAIP